MFQSARNTADAADQSLLERPHSFQANGAAQREHENSQLPLTADIQGRRQKEEEPAGHFGEFKHPVYFWIGERHRRGRIQKKHEHPSKAGRPVESRLSRSRPEEGAGGDADRKQVHQGEFQPTSGAAIPVVAEKIHVEPVRNDGSCNHDKKGRVPGALGKGRDRNAHGDGQKQQGQSDEILCFHLGRSSPARINAGAPGGGCWWRRTDHAPACSCRRWSS